MERTMNKKMDMKNMEMGVFCEELLEEILTRVPFKPLNKMLCVSKGWYHFITHLQRTRPHTSVSGLCIQHMTFADRLTMPLNTQVTFLNVEAQGRDIVCTGRDLLSFSLDKYCPISSSSNGLFLCSSLKGKYYVCNPTLNQWALLPPVEGLSLGGIGLAYDGLPNHQYKVICFSKNRQITSQGFMDCTIFSSKTGKWKNVQRRLLNHLLMSNVNYNDHIPFLFRDGVLHWIINGYMLDYHIHCKIFKVKELPMTRVEGHKSSNNLFESDECLWDSQGFLHYCHVYRNGFCIWAHGEEDVDNINIIGKWQLKYKLEPETMVAHYPKIFSSPDRILGYQNTTTTYSESMLRPCGFNEDLQIFFFRYGGMIFSYSFVTRTMKKLCTYPYTPSSGFSNHFMVHSFLFSSVDLPVGGESKLLMPEKESSQITVRPRLLLDL